MTKRNNSNKSHYNLKKLRPNALKEKIYKQFSLNPKKRYSAKQLKKKLKLANKPSAILLAMQELEKQDKIAHHKDGKFKINKNANHHRQSSSNKKNRNYKNYEGIVDMTRSGAAFILVDELHKDIFVNPSQINGAMNGDTVLVRSSVSNGSSKKPTGQIVKIIKRAQTKFIGKLVKKGNQAYIEVNHKGQSFQMAANMDDVANLQDGVKVKAAMIENDDKGRQLYKAEDIESLKYASTNDIAMTEILYNNGFAQEFPEHIEKEASQLKMVLDEAELSKRRDFRDVLTMTIDPETAKDFDDAISYQKLEDGRFEIGVHIADVTHFLKPGTALDKEAYKRATSVYLVDRVAPMLPEVLSNDLCSLNPHEDKFCFSASFVFDQQWNIVDRWFGKTVIHSDRRFTYEEAQERIETGDGDYATEIQFLNKVATSMREQRFREGGISFETEELRFLLDEHGKPTDVYVKERKEAHMMIEDFMLLANREVAKYIHEKANGQEIPFVYRVHDEPDPERLAEFANFAKEMGIQILFDTPKQVAESFNKLAELADDNDALKILEPLAIRTMAKAVYSTDNIGHYGLGFQFYAHFTSPIRRYADVLVHRVLFENLDSVKRYEKSALEQQSLHISAQERKAVDAERESIKYKQVEWALEHIDETYDAMVSGIIDRGIFVTLKNSLVEGMVEFKNIGDSYHVESRMRASAKYSSDVIKIGDSIRVTIRKADLDRREIDLELSLESEN